MCNRIKLPSDPYGKKTRKALFQMEKTRKVLFQTFKKIRISKKTFLV
jgi:hypothetical protein